MIVRRLVRTDAQVIGFLPANRGTAAALPPLLSEWAATMVNFMPGRIGVVAEWSAWDGMAGGAVVEDERHARLFSVVPPPRPDAGSATPALDEAVSNHRRNFARILINLSRYAASGHVPAAAEFTDGVAIIVPAGRLHRRRLKTLAHDLDRRNLGAILID